LSDRYHHGRLREALLESSVEILSEGGPRALSLREAARRAGVSSGAPYRHFRDKDQLLAAIALRAFEAFDADLAAAGAEARGHDASPLEVLRQLGVAYVRFSAEHPAEFRLMFGEFAPKREPDSELGKAVQSAAGHLSRAVDELLRAAGGSPSAKQDTTVLAWSLVHGLAALHLDGHLGASDPESVTAAAQRLTTTLMHAIASSLKLS